MSRQPWRDCPIGSRRFEAHEDRLREQAERLDKDQHLGTMGGLREPVTPETRARRARLEAALKDIESRQAEANRGRSLNSYDQGRLDNIEAIAEGAEVEQDTDKAEDMKAALRAVLAISMGWPDATE